MTPTISIINVAKYLCHITNYLQETEANPTKSNPKTPFQSMLQMEQKERGERTGERGGGSPLFLSSTKTKSSSLSSLFHSTSPTLNTTQNLISYRDDNLNRFQSEFLTPEWVKSASSGFFFIIIFLFSFFFF